MLCKEIKISDTQMIKLTGTQTYIVQSSDGDQPAKKVMFICII